MAEIKSFPNNQDEYIGAEYVMKWHHGRTSGVFGANGNCAVSAVAENMAVTVSDGTGWMANSNADGIVWWNDAEKNSGEKLKLSVDVADGVLNRIDRVIAEWETTNYVARPSIKILKGLTASNPTAPSLTNNSTIRQISLARIYIAAGTLSLTNSMITDERTDPTVCGIVTESVSVDTSMIHANVDATLDEVKKETSKTILYVTSEANETLENTKKQSRAILDAISDELADLEAGTAVELKKLQFSDMVVSRTAFVADNTYQDYPYRAAVALDGVISSMIPFVTLSLQDSTSGNFAPVSETYNGGVYLYAASVPESDMTVPTILCFRGNG